MVWKQLLNMVKRLERGRLMDELEKLKTEIKILNKRISALERAEARRNAFKGFRILIKLLLFIALIYGIWYAYDYVTNYVPNQIKESINNFIPESLR